MKTARIVATLFAVAALLTVGSVDAQTSTPPSESYQVNQQRQNGQSQANMAEVPLKEAIVKKLVKANEAEIELAKMAKEKTENSEVRQLTETIINDHQDCNEKLKACCNMQNDRASSRQNGTHSPNQQTYTANKTRSMKNSDTVMVPHQLCEISEQACDNMLKMTKDMLSQYDGQDFTMAFLGQQCVAHTAMLAELKAIQSTGPEDLKSVVGPAIDKMEMHLDKVKSLAKKYENDARSNSNR